MALLVANARVMIETAIMQNYPDIHSFVCQALADKYDLWYDNHLPMWLSYVVTGIMNETEKSLT